MSICSRRRGAFLASSKRRLDLPVIKTFLISATLVALVSLSSQAAEIIPPKPAGYFNDYAGVVSKEAALHLDRKSTRLNSSHLGISYAVFCLKKKKKKKTV